MFLVQRVSFYFAQKFLLRQMTEQKSDKFNGFFQTGYTKLTNIYEGNKASWQIYSVSNSAQLTFLEHYEGAQEVSS